MRIAGDLYYDGAWHRGEGGGFEAVDPATRGKIPPLMSMASPVQVDRAVAAAHRALPKYAATAPEVRAAFLRACADEVMALGDALVERVTAETGHPRARAEGERGRTCMQLRMFADVVERGEHFDARIDTAQPQRQPLPKPDLRHVNHALGPVVVFGASNFPLAFSVAGGDTASALAAGCPVLVKGHPSHPGTSELVGRALAKAAEAQGMPPGVFSLLTGAGRDVGAQLVQAPQVKAVAFTGSFAGGMALHKLACERPDPIPVFAEMGSTNPVVLLPDALRDGAAAIARNFVASMTLGTGQFCTNPGLVVALAGDALEAFVREVSAALATVDAGVMLNQRIHDAYGRGVDGHGRVDGVDIAAHGNAVGAAQGFRAQAFLFRTRAARFLDSPRIREEVFGPTSLLVECADRDELLAVVAALDGQLTASIHAAGAELERYRDLVDLLARKAGRLVVNGFPTGVEVCAAMVHGGPFPATTDARFTSVGTTAIRRFLRPVCFQNCPDALLPDALKNGNPLNLVRLVDGQATRAPVG